MHKNKCNQEVDVFCNKNHKILMNRNEEHTEKN